MIKKTDLLFDVVFAILLFSLPLSMAIPNLALVLLLLLFFIKKERVFSSNFYIKLVVIFIGFLILKALLNSAFLTNFNLYKHLLIIPILSVLSINIKNTSMVKQGFILGVFLAVIISLIQILGYYFIHKTIPLGNTSEANQLLLIHRPYFGFLCVLGVLVIDILKKDAQNKTLKRCYNFIGLLFLFFIIIIAARLSLFLIVLFLFVKGIHKYRFSKRKQIFTIVVFLGTVTGIFLLNENIKERFHIKNSLQETIKVIKNQEPRFVIWNCVFSQVSSPQFNVFLGFKNVKTIQTNLNECYDQRIENVSKKHYYLATEFNTHNQFFDIFLQGGIIGLFLFLCLFGYSFYFFRSDTMSTLTVLSFFLFGVFENIFHRQLGVYLFAIFISLLHNKITVKKG